MAEFQEFIKQFNRMCWSYQREHKCPMACPMNGVNISQCRKIAFEQSKETEEIVMRWAAEHPEPVYETWFEYLLRIGVIPENAPAGGEYQWIVESIKHKHISNDIAESLKLHPKEVQA